MKKIHIINPYGTLPNEGWRKYRTNIVAEHFAKNNFDVTYWISNIDHRSKTHRKEKKSIVEVDQNFRYRIIASPEYNKNGSFGRIKYERGFGKNVKNIFFRENLDANIILLTDPALFYGNYIYDIVKKTKSKFFIDILDLWPEVFSTVFPEKLKFASDYILAPLYYLRKKLYQKADGFLSVTHDYLEVAHKACPNKPGAVIYIGIDNTDLGRKELNISKKENETWIIYAGTLGINYDIKTILEFAKKLEKSTFNAKLIIAGDGPLKEEIITTIKNKNLLKTLFLGRLSADELSSLYENCDIALSTYLETSTVSMPVKAFDYIAYGLPVLNSLKREYGNLVVNKKIGLQYEAENTDSLFTQFSKLILDNNLYLELKLNSLLLKKDYQIENLYSKYVSFVNEN